MYCRETTRREIQKAIYRLQFIYNNGDAEILDKYPDLFMAIMSRSKHRSIIETDHYILNPDHQTLETCNKIYYFPKQEFDLLYVLAYSKGKPMHQERLRTCVLTKYNDPIPHKTFMILTHRINNKLDGSDIFVINVGHSSYVLSKGQDLKKKPLLPKTVIIDGKEMTVNEAIELYGVGYNRVYNRVADGWSIEEAVRSPLLKPYGRKAA